jgi:hypothetical protein
VFGFQFDGVLQLPLVTFHVYDAAFAAWPRKAMDAASARVLRQRGNIDA